MIGQEMKEEILDLEGEVNTREILAILLKYKKRHREALRDSEVCDVILHKLYHL